MLGHGGDKFILADKLAADVMTRARLNDDQWTRVRDVDPIDRDGGGVSHPLARCRRLRRRLGQTSAISAPPSSSPTRKAPGSSTAPRPTGWRNMSFIPHPELGMLEQVITYNVLDDGSFRPDLPFFGGTYILSRKGKEGDANKAVIDKLVEVGGLLARGKIKHSYPHSWRSKAPVIYRNTPQWFAAIDRTVGDGQDEFGSTIRERALKSIDELVQWTPQTGRNRLYSMIEARPDWVLSRQRAWGVPLTCFKKVGALPTDEGFLLRDEKVNVRILDAFEEEGADAWYKPGAKERFLGNDYDPSEWEKVDDILDVWFDSGSTHAFVLRDREDGSDDGWPICIWKAPTSTAAGSIPRCCRPAAPLAARLIAGC